MNAKCTRRNRRSAGFTLIEVLLAMAITAFVAVVAYTGLSTAITAAEVNEAQATRLAEVQIAVSLLERDLRHASPRPIIDEYGSMQDALQGGVFTPYPLQLTRIGWDNPRNLRRGEIQRVRYFLEDRELWRQSWAVLDRVGESETEQLVLLLDGVEDFRVRFLRPGDASGFSGEGEVSGDWVAEWNSGAASEMPQAVEFVLEIESFGEARRVIEIVSP